MDAVEMIEVTTRECICCHQRGKVTVPKAEWEAWNLGRGPHIQTAMPSVNADTREQILTGTHPKCWDELWAGIDEED